FNPADAVSKYLAWRSSICHSTFYFYRFSGYGKIILSLRLSRSLSKGGKDVPAPGIYTDRRDDRLFARKRTARPA
ncbi:MAG: hypothetical protein WB424_10295, partial [Terracidiphilus sp.]